MNAAAGEINVPIDHKYGVRDEFVWKHSPLSEETIAGNGAGTIVRRRRSQGLLRCTARPGSGCWATIASSATSRAWSRSCATRSSACRPPQHGLMVAARYEHLDENVTERTRRRATDRCRTRRRSGRPRSTSWELGVNYWHSKRFRATFNYVLNHFGGEHASVTSTASDEPLNEQEFLFRLAIAL